MTMHLPPVTTVGWNVKGLGAALAVAAFLAGCASPAPQTPGEVRYAVGKPYRVNGARYLPHAHPGYGAVGIASWYGREFHGRRTASGRRFDMHALTAAHKTLPFGTKVRVTNLENNRSVVVTITDRGPFVKGRIVDLSMRAAEVLGFKRKGKAKVRVEVVG